MSGSKVLVIVNAIELVKQTARHIKKVLPHLRVEIEQGAHHATGHADVTIAMVQSLSSGDRLSKFTADDYKAIIIDEAHHAAAKSYQGVLEHFGATTAETTVPVLGFSATLRRHDGRALSVAFDHIVFHRNFIDLVKDQWLCDVKFTTVQVDIDLDAVGLSATGDFNRRALAKAMNRPTLNNVAVRAWLDRARNRRSTLVFCADIAHVEALTARFRENGIDAKNVTSHTDRNERDVILDDFKAGKFPVLLNCDILTEGTDIPQVDCVLLARPTRSLNLFQQMIGRGMRLAQGKQDCLMLDLVGSFKGGLVCSPTLFGLRPDEEIEEASLTDLVERKKQQEQEMQQAVHSKIFDPSELVYIDYDNPEDVNSDASGLAPQVRELSLNAWVGCGNEKYILDLMGQGYIQLVKEEDEYVAHDYRVRAGTYLRPVQILVADNLGSAIRGCDTYTKTRCKFSQGLLRTAAWRSKPASDGQMKIVGALIDFERMTKGHAANIITRRMHGAWKRYDDKKRKEKNQQIKVDKLKQWQDDMQIRLGPIHA